MYNPDTGDFSERVMVALNDLPPELQDGYKTSLNPGDRITLMQAYAGGQAGLALEPRGFVCGNASY